MSNLSIRDTIKGSIAIVEDSTKGIVKGSIAIGKGDKGEQGIQGVKGDKGDKGDNNVCIGLSPTSEAEIWFDTTDGDNTKEVATKEYIDSEIAKIDSSNFATKTELSNKADKEHIHNQYLTEHQDISHKVDKETGKSLISDSEIERLSTLKNYDDSNIRSQLNDIENEVNELKEGNIDIDLTNYATKSELSTKADKSELHSHNNKNVLDQISTYTLGQWNGHINNLDAHITASERTKWNNKSDFSGIYNDLTNKPTIPSLNGYATEQYVNEEINKIDVTEQLTDYAKKSDLEVKADISYVDSAIESVDVSSQLTNYATKTELGNKVDKIDGKGLSTNDYTTAEKDKLSGLTNYTHPTSHSATMITEDSTHRFVTDSEKSSWNNKSNLALGTTSTTAFRGDYGNTAYTHSQSAHAPSNAQKNSDITKSEIEAKLRGDITTHSHSMYALASDIKTKDNFVINISSIFAPSPQLSANGVAIIVNSLDEMIDISKKYVLNGYIYECVPTENVTSYTNVLKTAKDTNGTIYNGKGYKDNTRLNSSGEVKDASGIDIDTSGKISCKVGDTLRIQNVKSSMNYATYIYSYNDSNVKQGGYTIYQALATTQLKNIEMKLDSATFGANFTNIRFCSGDINDNTIVTINEPIENSTEVVYEWVNTGEKYEYGDFDAETCTAQDIYDYLEVLCSKYPNYITKETLGKDESGTFDCNRYVLSKHFYQAWQKVNYPKMYAFINGSTTIYATSVSPRIGDTLYTTKYIGTSYAKVTAVDTPNQTRTINGKLFTRDESKDVEPTLVYTSILADSVSPNGIVYNENQSGISMIATISKTSMSDNKGVSYKRYPLGDKNRNMEKPIVVTIGANEHGPQGDPKEPAIICARFIKDLCECKNSDNELLNHLKNNIMLVIMPIINPYGFTNGDDPSANRYGYYNYNQVNINRNYDCIGFGKETNAGDCGDYGGSENETQYYMNTLAEPKSVVGISIHCLGYTTGGNDGLCHYQGNGFNADKMNEIAENMKANYNLKFTSYGEAPQETTSKSPTYITKIGAKGGIIEFQAREGNMSESTSALHTSRIMEANYTLLLECIYAFLTD